MRRSIPRPRGATPARGLVVALALLLTACGGIATQGDDAAAGGEEGGTVDTVKIGAPYPLSGTWAQFGQNSLAGMEAAAEQLNADGGIEGLGGAEVEIVPVDTGSEPAQAQAVTTKLIQDEQVTALVGSYLSNLTLTTSTAAESARVPMVTQSFVDEITGRGYENIFQLPPRSSSFGEQTVAYYQEIAAATGRQVSRAVAVSSNDAAGKAQADAVAKAAQAAGIEMPAPIVYPPGISDATAIVGQIVSAKPDVVFSYGPVPDTVLIVRNLRGRGVQVPIIGTGGTGLLDKGIPEALGPLAEGLMSLSAWNDDMKLPGVPEIAAAYKDAHPDAAFVPQEAGESYAAVYLIAQAVEEAGSADPAAVRDALAAIKASGDVAAAMPAGEVEFDADGMNKHAFPIVIQWRDGIPRTIWPEDLASVPVS